MAEGPEEVEALAAAPELAPFRIPFRAAKVITGAEVQEESVCTEKLTAKILGKAPEELPKGILFDEAALLVLMNPQPNSKFPSLW